MVIETIGLPRSRCGMIGNCGRRSTSFVGIDWDGDVVASVAAIVDMAIGFDVAGECFGDLERFRGSRFEVLSLDDLGDDLLLSYDDGFRGDFELSFGDVLDDLLVVRLPADSE